VNQPLISADALSGRRQNPIFFREMMQRLLVAPEPAYGRFAPAGNNPLADEQTPTHVIIVVSDAIRFARGADVQPLTSMPGCNCRVFYVRCSWLEFDELDRMIRPLNRTRFDLRSYSAMRRALRKMIDEMEKL
jgi:hypothetical protein